MPERLCRSVAPQAGQQATVTAEAEEEVGMHYFTQKYRHTQPQLLLVSLDISHLAFGSDSASPVSGEADAANVTSPTRRPPWANAARANGTTAV
jgi:hypothetical protein